MPRLQVSISDSALCWLRRDIARRLRAGALAAASTRYAEEALSAVDTLSEAFLDTPDRVTSKHYTLVVCEAEGQSL